jgi:hypothetical protein
MAWEANFRIWPLVHVAATVEGSNANLLPHRCTTLSRCICIVKAAARPSSLLRALAAWQRVHQLTSYQEVTHTSLLAVTISDDHFMKYLKHNEQHKRVTSLRAGPSADVARWCTQQRRVLRKHRVKARPRIMQAISIGSEAVSGHCMVISPVVRLHQLTSFSCATIKRQLYLHQACHQQHVCRPAQFLMSSTTLLLRCIACARSPALWHARLVHDGFCLWQW